MNVSYTRELDTNNSSVVDRVLFDSRSETLYLVFQNGTVVSREVAPLMEYGLDNLINYFEGSWGRAWNGKLRYLNGENLMTDVNFVARPSAQVAAENEPDDNNYLLLLTVSLPRDVALEAFAHFMALEADLREDYGDFYSNISISNTPEETE